jgi:2-polyprenyl-6-methoxyphenol hydroxylase-like FAD-dependent oxidoreductase
MSRVASIGLHVEKPRPGRRIRPATRSGRPPKEESFGSTRRSDVRLTSSKVAVVGAGLSGLTFAAATKRLAPALEVSVYERDASPTSRSQGYAIGLRKGFGLKALDELGLREPAVGQDAFKVTDFAILDQRGRLLLSLPGRHPLCHQFFLSAVLSQPDRFGFLKIGLSQAAKLAEQGGSRRVI